MGALDYLSNFCTVTSTRSRKRKPMQTVEIKVKMDCDGCERRVKNAVTSMKGVRSVEVDRKQSRVKVSGFVDPNKVLKKVKSTGKRAEFWPYIPYNLVYYPFASQAYDKRAPAGYVRNVAQAVPAAAGPMAPEERFTFLFSDDNPNACSIM
ncbi:heavy metal-associated isoprenylated plant protein 21-like [Diospyros lotus]|uniref:heavy metal-associated isoprenylated plant protein 21-like n=1 Tax=Diospyros lotus TaxID=55363 RepID=UPI00224CE5D6|nr:heavy metal-associated isoprenylated plant protein 21-like [Diospyros lotus]